MKNILVIQHVRWEGPGRFLREAFERHRVEAAVCRVYCEPLPPDLSFFDAFIILGGGPNVDEEEKYPFLSAEKRAIREMIALDRPVLGFCLGHQLLAEALGARIGPNPATSVGFIDGFLCRRGREHPLFAGMNQATGAPVRAPKPRPRRPGIRSQGAPDARKKPAQRTGSYVSGLMTPQMGYPVTGYAGITERLPLFKWHGQAVLEPLPDRLELLATSRDCQVEAFSVKGRPHICGLQFDNHAAHPDDVAVWVREDESWLASRRDLRLSPETLVREAAAQEARQRSFFARLMKNFFGFAEAANSHA